MTNLHSIPLAVCATLLLACGCAADQSARTDSRPSTSSTVGGSTSDHGDESGGDGGTSPSLSTEQIKEGLAAIRKSVATCRKRQSEQREPLTVSKVTLKLEVEPEGTVSDFAVDPKYLRQTAFEQCLRTEHNQWNFGPFDGETQKMRVPFQLR